MNKFPIDEFKLALGSERSAGWIRFYYVSQRGRLLRLALPEVAQDPTSLTRCREDKYQASTEVPPARCNID